MKVDNYQTNVHGVMIVIQFIGDEILSIISPPWAKKRHEEIAIQRFNEHMEMCDLEKGFSE